MKKLQSLFLVFAIVFFSISGSVLASFPDVSSSHLNSDAIDYVQAVGIVDGYPDGNYQPDWLINRAEFTKIIVNAVFDTNVTEYPITLNCFPDVDAQEWFAPFVCLAYDAGIIDGYPDGTFKPAENINFVEAAKIVMNAFEFVLYEYSISDEWFVAFVDTISLYNAIPTSIVSFDHNISRGEMAEIIYRLLDNVVSKESQTFESLQNNQQDNRIILNSENRNDENFKNENRCDVDFNNSDATTTVRYVNEEKGITLDLPYNPDWGNEIYKVAPYFETDFSVGFGGLYVFEACSWANAYSLYFTDAATTEEVETSIINLELETGLVEYYGTEYIGGYEAVKYLDYGLCSYPTIEVPGELYNYRLVPTCGGEIEEEFAYLESILESILINDNPFLDLEDDDPTLGSPDAKVSIVEFIDFQCPACKSFHDGVFPLLKQYYIDTGLVRFVMRIT